MCRRFDVEDPRHVRIVTETPHLITALPHGAPCIVFITRALGTEICAIMPRSRPGPVWLATVHVSARAYEGTVLFGNLGTAANDGRPRTLSVVDAAMLGGRVVPGKERIPDRVRRARDFMRDSWFAVDGLDPIRWVFHRFWPTSSLSAMARSAIVQSPTLTSRCSVRGFMLVAEHGRCTQVFVCSTRGPWTACGSVGVDSKSPPPSSSIPVEPPETVPIVPRCEFYAYRTKAPDVYTLIPVNPVVWNPVVFKSDAAIRATTLCVKTLHASRRLDMMFRTSSTDRVRIMCMLDRDFARWIPEFSDQVSENICVS